MKKDAQPKIPASIHARVKAEAKRRGRHLKQFYAEVIKAGLDIVKGKKS